MTALLYTAELDLADADVRPFLDWYAYRHVPDLFPLGFVSCACYQTSGADMNLFDIYEIPSHAVFSAPGYRRMNERDAYAARILEKRRNKAHTIYEQVDLRAGPPDSGTDLDADWITVARFDAKGDLGTIAAALSEGHSAWAGSMGLLRARLGVRTDDHPIYTTFRPRCMLLLEWNQPQETAHDITDDLALRMSTPQLNVDIFRATRLYPWTTQPQIATL